MAAKLQDLMDRWKRLQTERAPWDTDWRDLAEYLLPQRAKAILGAAPGEKKTAKIYDSEGVTAPTMLKAALHGNLTNPAQQWLTLAMRDDDLNDVDEVQDWSDDSTLRYLRANASSNFYNEIAQQYLDGPVFGTGAIVLEERTPTDPRRFPGFLYTALPIGSYCISENPEGRVDTLFYATEMALRAAYAKWGEQIGKVLLEKHAANPDQMVTLVHAIYPRDEADRSPQKGRRRREALPVASCWFWPEQDGVLLQEGGYHEFPGAVWRWDKQTGEFYGTGQGHLALPDIRTLNRIQQLKLEGAAMDIIPPTYEQDRAIIGEHIREPGARNYVKGDPRTAIHMIGSGARYDITKYLEDRLEAKIRRIFFVDQIAAILPQQNVPQRTAFEIAQILAEVAKLLGPAFGRMTTECHSPLVERGIRIMARWGALRPLPDLLRQTPDAEMDIRYEGPLAKAQQADDVAATERYFAFLERTVAATQDTSLLDNVDLDEAAQHYARVIGVPAKITRGKDRVAEVRAQRQQQQQAAAGMQTMQAVAEAAGKAAPMVKALQPGPGAPA